MKITFIKPNLMDTRSSTAFEPLAFAVLAAETPHGIDLEFYDERVEQVPLNPDSDLVGISVSAYSARRAYRLADALRQKGIPVVMGGHHATACPDEAKSHSDAVVIGEAEDIWKELIADIQRKELRPFYRRQNKPDLRDISYDRSIFKGKSYAPFMCVEFGRGCTNACDFCSVHTFYGHPPRHRPVDHVVEEIRGSSKKLILFTDDNIYSHKKRRISCFAPWFRSR